MHKSLSGFFAPFHWLVCLARTNSKIAEYSHFYNLSSYLQRISSPFLLKKKGLDIPDHFTFQRNFRVSLTDTT